MLIPSTITARRTRRYTSTWYIHPTTHKHDFEPIEWRQDGTFFNRHNVRQSIRPGGPLYLRLLQIILLRNCRLTTVIQLQRIGNIVQCTPQCVRLLSRAGRTS